MHCLVFESIWHSMFLDLHNIIFILKILQHVSLVGLTHFCLLAILDNVNTTTWTIGPLAYCIYYLWTWDRPRFGFPEAFTPRAEDVTLPSFLRRAFLISIFQWVLYHSCRVFPSQFVFCEDSWDWWERPARWSTIDVVVPAALRQTMARKHSWW